MVWIIIALGSLLAYHGPSSARATDALLAYSPSASARALASSPSARAVATTTKRAAAAAHLASPPSPADEPVPAAGPPALPARADPAQAGGSGPLPAMIDAGDTEANEGFDLFPGGDHQVTIIPAPWTKVTIRDDDR